MRIEIGGREPLEIENLLVDFNGTLAQGGEISEAAKELLTQLAKESAVYVATADTRGNAASACAGKSGLLPVTRALRKSNTSVRTA